MRATIHLLTARDALALRPLTQPVLLRAFRGNQLKLLPGVDLTTANVHGALNACAYDLAAHGTSPWCDVFTKSEIEDFEYELDLLMDVAFGYNLPTPMGQILGGLYVKTLAERCVPSGIHHTIQGY